MGTWAGAVLPRLSSLFINHKHSDSRKHSLLGSMTVSRPVGARHVRFAPPRVHVFALVVVVVVAVAYVALTCSLADAASVGGPVTVVHLATHGRRILVQKGLRLSSGNATALANHEYGAHGEHWGDEYHGTTQVVACTEEKHGVNATLLASISAAIRGAGVVAGYLPHDCVLATVTPEAAAILATVPGVAGVREVPAGKHRLSHEAARLVDALDAAAVARTDDLTSALPGWVKVVHPNTVGGNRTTAPLVALEVALPPASSQAKATNAAQAAVTSWTPRLRATTCPSCELTPRATPRGAAYVDVTTAAEHAADAIRWLSERPAAHLVSPQPADARVQNYHASAIVQNGGTALADSNYARPLWEVGIDGTGEIVGCGDSGIDVNSCFFRDNNGNEIGANHRKLVMYRALGDNVDGNGHGTHVAGSIAGAVSGIPGVSSRYDGVARGARIAFTDLGTGRDGSLMTPRDLSSGYFEVAYRAGARIHSDSWGSTSLSYTSSSREIDEFCWARRSFLPVFAAGNYGEYSTGGRTVTAPANAKCALAVGASLTQNGPAPFVDATTFFFRVIGGMPLSGFSEAELYRAMGARFGPDWDDSLGSQERLVVVPATVLDACVRWDVTTGLPPGSKVVFLVERGTCSFTIKARNAQAAGGVGMMVYNNVDRVGSSSNNLRQQSSSGRGQPPSRASSALVCSVCGWEAPNPQTLELHLGEHAVLDSTSSPRAGGGFGVGGQTVTFSTHAAARAQAPPPAAATVPEQSTMKCPICGFGATSIGALNNHIDLAHGTSPDPPSIARRDPSQLPARRSTPPREGVFATQSLPFGHQNELHEASILPRFDDAPRRQQHVPAHASRSINTGGHLVCPICGAHASDMAAMSAHMDAAHS